jgi:hypothetical protein
MKEEFWHYNKEKREKWKFNFKKKDMMNYKIPLIQFLPN